MNFPCSELSFISLRFIIKMGSKNSKQIKASKLVKGTAMSNSANLEENKIYELNDNQEFGVISDNLHENGKDLMKDKNKGNKSV